jgi:hypothetical protein
MGAALIFYAIVFGPSVIGLSVLFYVTFFTRRGGPFFLSLLLAVLLHGLTAAMLAAAVGYGEAWSGYSSAHNQPRAVLWSGIAVILAFVVAKGFIPQLRPRIPPSSSSTPASTKYDY